MPSVSTAEHIWWWLIRLGGLAIAIYEAVFEHVDRPEILLLAAGMMAIHSAVKADAAREGRNDDKNKNSG